MTKIETHASNVALWRETSAMAGYPAPPTNEQKAAYGLLPTLLDWLKESYGAIPMDATGRPAHYLMMTV